MRWSTAVSIAAGVGLGIVGALLAADRLSVSPDPVQTPPQPTVTVVSLNPCQSPAVESGGSCVSVVVITRISTPPPTTVTAPAGG